MKFSINNSAGRLWFDLLIFSGLGLLTFWLSVHYSKDWIHYNFLFSKITKLSWFTVFEGFSFVKEPLYYFPSKFFGEWLGFSAFVLMTTVVLLTLKLHYLKKLSKNEYWGIYFYICMYLLLFEGTAIRVGYSVALLIPALYLIRVQKYGFAAVLILLASQIHFTALFYLLAFPLYFFTVAKKIVFSLTVVSVLIVWLDFSLLSLFRELIVMVNPKYAFYFKESRVIAQNSTGLYFYFIGFFIAILITIHHFLKKEIAEERWLNMMFCICCLAIFFMCAFHDYVAVGARLGELFLVPMVVLLNDLLIKFRQSKMYLQQSCLIGIFFLYFLARLAYLYPALFTGSA